MPADVSGLVNMLATQPGQQMAQLGKTLAGAEEANVKAAQQRVENARVAAKDALEAEVSAGKIAESDLDILKSQTEQAGGLAQGILTIPDSMARQQYISTNADKFEQLGLSSQEAMQNVDNEEYWSAKFAETLGAKDFLTLQQGTSVKPSIAAKKTAELIAAEKKRGTYTPGYDYVAEGLAYGAYKQFQDQTTGDIILRDTRTNARLTPEEAAPILEQMPSESQFGKAKEVVVRRGDKPERLLQKNVKELSRDMGKTGAPRLENILNKIEGIMEPAWDNGKGDIPGYGITAMAPDWAVTQEGQDLRQSLVKLFNVELAERSGAAVTKQELDRLKDEFKSGGWKTDRQLMEGIKAYRSLLEDYKKAVFSGYDDKVKSRYWEQEGLTLKENKWEQDDQAKIDKAEKQAAGAPTAEQIRADGKINKWTEDEINDAIKQYGAK